MSDLPYLAIALALRPELADSLRQNPQDAVSGMGLSLNAEELTKLSSLLSAGAGGEAVGRPVFGMAPPIAAAGHFKPTHLASANRHKLELGEHGRDAVIDAIAPTILELDRVKHDIASGLEISIPGVGPLAKVSGNVVGSCTVDW